MSGPPTFSLTLSSMAAASSPSMLPGFLHRWQRARNSESVSSALVGAEHVSGLGIFFASLQGGSVEAPRPTADMATHAEGRARVQDRLVWEQLRPSRRSMWSGRKEIQMEVGLSIR
jgi:hypothetical protein